jgi:YHS domain-containing protein
MTVIRRTTFTIALLLVSVGGMLSGRQTPGINIDRGGLAIHGYDAVAYVTKGTAIKGRAEFEYRWQNVTWRFESDQHRERFAKSPELYAPQFGGYCAWAVSRGYTADIDPEAWRVVDGKLYLNYSKRVQRRWEQDVPGNIAKGNSNWPGVLSR